jgi:hypothetical protein
MVEPSGKVTVRGPSTFLKYMVDPLIHQARTMQGATLMASETGAC